MLSIISITIATWACCYSDTERTARWFSQAPGHTTRPSAGQLACDKEVAIKEKRKKANLFNSVSFSLLPWTKALWWPSFLGVELELQGPRIEGLSFLRTGLKVNLGGLQSPLGGLQPAVGESWPASKGLSASGGGDLPAIEGVQPVSMGLLGDKNCDTFMRELWNQETHL